MSNTDRLLSYAKAMKAIDNSGKEKGADSDKESVLSKLKTLKEDTREDA